MDQEKPPRRIPHWVRLPLMMVLLFLISLAILRSNSLQQDFPHDHTNSEERKDFPDLIMFDENSEQRKLSSFKGYVTIVSFWATWCAPCIEELPYFSSLAQSYPKDLRIAAINQDQDVDIKSTIDQLWEKYKIPFATYYDPEGHLARQVGLEVLPSNYILDRQGKLVFSSFGAYNWKSKEAIEFLEELIKEPLTK